MGPGSAPLTSRLKLVKPIGEGIHLYEPPTPTTRSTDPSLIILCTWLGGATPRRINKYIAGYHALYPNSALLVITTKIAEITFLPFTALHARLQPARDTIRRFASTCTDIAEPSMLLHIFSHGGCNSATQLLHSIQSPQSAEEPILDLRQYLSGIIFDCCPGDATFGRAYNAAAASLPDMWLARAFGRPLLVPVIGVITGLQSIGAMSSVKDLRRELNSFGLFGSTANRLYLYSLSDQMVQWEDVESHLEEAKSIHKYTATGVSFADSAHCAIVHEHPEHYWKAIQNLWNGKDFSRRSRL